MFITITNNSKIHLKLTLQKIGLISLLVTFLSCNNSSGNLATGPGNTLLQKFHYYYRNYDFLYHTKNDTGKAKLYADSMLNLFDSPAKKTEYPYYYGQAYFFKGDIFFDEEDYDKAYQYYYLGKTIASNNLDACTMGEYSYRMGMIMYKQEHFRIAAAYFKLSSKQSGTCAWNFSIFYRMQELLNNTGLSYSKINEADSAMMYYKKALEFINQKGALVNADKRYLDVARGVVYGNEADIYIKKNNFRTAENLLKKSIAINLRKGNDNHDAELSELKLAHLYAGENKTDSLGSLLMNVHRQFDSVKNPEAEADWNMVMAVYLDKKGLAGSAFTYLVRYDALNDSITSKNKELKETDVTEQMERLKKNYEFEQLERHNQLQRYYLEAAIVFGLMLIVIISLIFLNWQKSKKNIKILGTLNHQINDQNDNLEYALEQLKLSSQEKDRILRTVAHDLRNPVGGIASLSGLMAEESGYNEEQKELINLIKETSNNSLELINEILEITDNISAKLNKEKEPVEINALVNNSVELMRFKAAEKKQRIAVELLPGPKELFISREKIWRVISNLISNAIKFSNEQTEIRVTVTDETDQIKIAVADNGIGIPDNLKQKVFETFTDAKRPGTAGESSFGLGLSICQRILANHNGNIWFESNGGKGTIFYFTLKKTG